MADSSIAASGVTADEPNGSTRRLLLYATGWYLVNRAVTLLAIGTAVLVNDQRYGYSFAAKLGDGRWYLGVAQVGYFPKPLPPDVIQSIGSSRSSRR